MLGLLFVLSLHGGPEHPGGDSWFGADKMKHFLASAFVESVSYGAARTAGLGHGASMAAAATATAAVGIGKELHDRRAGGSFSVPDLTWDAAGGVAAGLLLDRMRK